MMVSVLSAFSVLGATVLAEPAVAEVEEMWWSDAFPQRRGLCALIMNLLLCSA